MSEDVAPGLALPGIVVTCFLVLPAKLGPAVATQINDYSMSLKIGGTIGDCSVQRRASLLRQERLQKVQAQEEGAGAWIRAAGRPDATRSMRRP